jgi:hypothetical protein
MFKVRWLGCRCIQQSPLLTCIKRTDDITMRSNERGVVLTFLLANMRIYAVTVPITVSCMLKIGPQTMCSLRESNALQVLLGPTERLLLVTVIYTKAWHVTNIPSHGPMVRFRKAH